MRGRAQRARLRGSCRLSSSWAPRAGRRRSRTTTSRRPATTATHAWCAAPAPFSATAAAAADDGRYSVLHWKETYTKARSSAGMLCLPRLMSSLAQAGDKWLILLAGCHPCFYLDLVAGAGVPPRARPGRAQELPGGGALLPARCGGGCRPCAHAQQPAPRARAQASSDTQ